MAPAGRFDVKPPAAEQQSAYLPKGPPEPLILEEFLGINTSTSRTGVDDKQMWWCDGFMPIGRRFLRTLYGVGEPITFSSSSSIEFFAFVNIGATPYAVAVLADGSIRAANTETYVESQIAVPGTIQSPSRLTVGISQYGNEYVLIVSSQTNGYFIWNGTTFYKPGDAAPVSGTMPLAISGTAVETYAGRVWIVNGSTLTYSAPGSLINFATNGGGNASSSDSFLRVRYTQLLQTNGFLYLIADSSINYISGVQTSGTPAVTTFTNQNADPETGTPWPSTVGTFGRNILFANAFGVHVSYGAAVTKISEPLDGFYSTVENFGGLIPSTAKATIFGKKVWMLLLPIVDPVTGQQVNKLCMWNGKVWWTSPQDVTLTYIQSQEIDSVLTAWGTDGMSIYPLFQQASTAFSKVVQSKLWDRPGGYQFLKTVTRFWAMVQYYSLLAPNLEVSIDNELGAAPNTVVSGPTSVSWTNNAGATATWTNNAAAAVTWYGSGTGIVVLDPTGVGQQGMLSGMTIETSAADMVLISAMIHDEIAAYKG